MDKLDALYAVLESQGIESVYHPIGIAKAATLCIMDDLVILVDKHKIQGRVDELCAVAHEKAHCETGALYHVNSPLSMKRKYENMALKHTIRELVPQQALAAAQRSGIFGVYDLAEYIGVTPELMQQALDYYEYGYIR